MFFGASRRTFKGYEVENLGFTPESSKFELHTLLQAKIFLFSGLICIKLKLKNFQTYSSAKDFHIILVSNTNILYTLYFMKI